MATRTDRKHQPSAAPAPGPAELSEPARKAWRALFITQRLALREVGRRLAEAGLPPLSWYDVLYTLHESPEHRLPHHELARRTMASPSGLSRLVDRLVERGLVERCQRTDDRRSLHVKLTEAGIEQMREIWPIYAGVIAEHFAPAIEGREQLFLEALENSAASLEAGGARQTGAAETC